MTIRKPFFVVPLNLGVVVAENSIAGYPVTHLGRSRDVGLVWKTTGTMWARGNMGDTKSINFAALLATNAQAGTNIRLRLGTSQSEVDGVAPYDSGNIPLIYSEPAGTTNVVDSIGQSFPTILLIPNSGGTSFAASNSVLNSGGTSFVVSSGARLELSVGGLRNSQLEIDTLQNAQWWRIDISGHSGTFSACSLILGEKIETSKFYNYGFERGGKDLGKIEIGRLGVVDEEPGIKLRTLDFTLGWQTEEEYETKFRPMAELIGETAPVYLCFDPSATIYRASKTYFGFLKNPAYARGSRKVATYEQTVSMLSLI